MIEEAAGTRLYESKKEAAQKTIEKKDAKLREIDNVCSNYKFSHCNNLGTEMLLLSDPSIQNSTIDRFYSLISVHIDRVYTLIK